MHLHVAEWPLDHPEWMFTPGTDLSCGLLDPALGFIKYAVLAVFRIGAAASRDLPDSRFQVELATRMMVASTWCPGAAAGLSVSGSAISGLFFRERG